jgi:hypothetical protein
VLQSKKKETRAGKIIMIGSLLVAATLCYPIPSQATSSCFCVGSNRAAGSCGHGGVAGNFMDVRKNLPDNLMKYLLLTHRQYCLSIFS